MVPDKEEKEKGLTLIYQASFIPAAAPHDYTPPL